MSRDTRPVWEWRTGRGLARVITLPAVAVRAWACLLRGDTQGAVDAVADAVRGR